MVILTSQCLFVMYKLPLNYYMVFRNLSKLICFRYITTLNKIPKIKSIMVHTDNRIS